MKELTHGDVTFMYDSDTGYGVVYAPEAEYDYQDISSISELIEVWEQSNARRNSL